MGTDYPTPYRMKLGDLWQDKDPRAYRIVEVIEIDYGPGVVLQDYDPVRVRVKTKKAYSPKAMGRKVWVRSDNLRSRFRYMGNVNDTTRA